MRGGGAKRAKRRENVDTDGKGDLAKLLPTLKIVDDEEETEGFAVGRRGDGRGDNASSPPSRVLSLSSLFSTFRERSKEGKLFFFLFLCNSSRDYSSLRDKRKVSKLFRNDKYLSLSRKSSFQKSFGKGENLWDLRRRFGYPTNFVTQLWKVSVI